MRRALELIAEAAKPIPMEQAQAREEIWTPEKEREEKGGLWTPGSELATCRSRSSPAPCPRQSKRSVRSPASSRSC